MPSTHSPARAPIANRLAVLAFLVAAPLLSAQQPRTVKPAPAPAPGSTGGWTVRTDPGGMDHGDGAQVRVEVMKPGWHVTTGPAAIVFDSTMRGAGNWRLEATLHLFDPGARAEGFGVFFGGRDLNGSAPRYSYALVRRDGRALLKVREGATTRTVREWATHRSIPVWRGGPAGTSLAYPLVIEATTDRVVMSIGGTQVLDAPRSELPSDGVVGLRINHALNVHVEKLVVTPLPRR
jgi:hypothetical protein